MSAIEMPRPYEGDRPYIFVDYAHADDDVVLPIINRLVCEGYRVWWDDGIELATDYPEIIARHVSGCECVLTLFSRAFLGSEWCRKEVEYADSLKKTILPVYLEDVELSVGLQMIMFNKQALFWYEFESDELFYRRLFNARRLDSCLTDKGRWRRGGKARRGALDVSESATTSNRAGVNVVPIGLPEVIGGDSALPSVVPRATLGEYSWEELKELSRSIATAGSDEEGLAIAHHYHLVDKVGKLSGNVKSVELKNGIKTSVRILGFRHDTLKAGSFGGITFEFSDIPMTYQMNLEWTNSGGWEMSGMRQWLNKDFVALLPEDLRQYLEVAQKRTNNEGKITRMNDATAVTVTDDRVWLLSQNEVYGNHSSICDNEGVQYQLYADQDVTASYYRFCSKSAVSWWLRSPHPYFTYSFLSVDYDGGCISDDANHVLGVSPGFCI